MIHFLKKELENCQHKKEFYKKQQKKQTPDKKDKA
jgi:hypothetical protein